MHLYLMRSLSLELVWLLTSAALYAQRTVMMIQPDEMSSEALQSEPVMERKEVLSTFEDAYRCIKEATGVTSIQVYSSSPSLPATVHIRCCEKASAPL